jgi:hypothetical protein
MYARRSIIVSGLRQAGARPSAAYLGGRQHQLLSLTAARSLHDPPTAENDDSQAARKETDKQKKINLEGSFVRSLASSLAHVACAHLRVVSSSSSTGRTVSDIPDAPLWNDRLASNSEANVKADRTPDQDVAELQEMTIKTIEMREEVEKTTTVDDDDGSPQDFANDVVKAFAKESKEFPAGP